MVSERGKGKGKVGQRSSSRNAGRAAEIVAPDVVPTSAAVLTLASVQPLPAPPAEHDAGALEASLTLASLSMPVLAAGVLGPGRDKSSADFCSDSSRLRFEALNPSTVSLPKRVDIPVILHAISASIVSLGRVFSC